MTSSDLGAPSAGVFDPDGDRWRADTDLVVVGGGIAGLTAAVDATAAGLRVLVVCKDAVDTATRYAQGGIAISDGLDIDAHVADTLNAGAGLCDPAAVRSIVSAGPAALAALVDRGAAFDRAADGSLSRTREGGHSTGRIVHAGGDATGDEIQRALSAAAPATLTGATAVRVLTGTTGVRGLLLATADGMGVVHAPAVLLATGGSGMLYASSTNPAGSTGDGIALALHAGAEIADVEFVQFHPTALFVPGGRGRLPLVSEAVRGEGARLVDLHGRSITEGVHPLGDLAPRDVVSRAIARRLADTGTDHVLLDATGVAHVHRRFPTVTAACLALGVDPAREPVPVAPAAHYACGGIVTDSRGRTAVPGLYAAGEVARTGLHGANRLASNSLLEGAVVGARVAVAARERIGVQGVPNADDRVPPAPRLTRAVLQSIMTRWVGVVRDADGLSSAAEVIAGAPVLPIGEIAHLEDASMTLLASAVVAAAAARTETRGAHTRSDHPDIDDGQRRSTHFRLQASAVLERLGASEPQFQGVS